jgi:hypothetical protein
MLPRIAAAVLLVSSLGCGGRRPASPGAPRHRGDWGPPCFYEDRWTCPQGGEMTRGRVGLPFRREVQARCEGGTWSALFTLATGVLPPGLAMTPDGTISGVPTAAGDWSFRVHLSDIFCAGERVRYYSDGQLVDADFDMDFRIVTEGSGPQ